MDWFYSCNSTKYMPFGVRVDNYFPWPTASWNSCPPELPRAYILQYCPHNQSIFVYYRKMNDELNRLTYGSHMLVRHWIQNLGQTWNTLGQTWNTFLCFETQFNNIFWSGPQFIYYRCNNYVARKVSFCAIAWTWRHRHSSPNCLITQGST